MPIKIALAGNPNSGKTTLFNALTGSNQFVGNWPGVTVEKKEGNLKNQKDVIITDLPGIYSLSPYTLEEIVSRNYLIDEKPDVILNIIDGTNLERNLFLTTQLTEIGIPVVIAVNMIDIVEKKGDEINFQKLSEKTGCVVTKISALKGEGITEAAQLAIKAAEQQKTEPKHSFSGEVEHTIAHIEEAVLHHLPEETQRFFAIKLFERDTKIAEKLQISSEKLNHIANDISRLEKVLGDEAENIIIMERYNYIDSIINDCITVKNKGTLSVSEKIDKIVTNRVLALPIFAIVMFIVYFISITTVGTVATDWANDGVFGDGWHLFNIGASDYEDAVSQYENTVLEYEELEKNADHLEEPAAADYGVYIPGVPVVVENLLDSVNCATWLKGLILDGIIAGVGAVLGFVPQMFILFAFLAFLERCGYMARIAFIMDKIFSKFGLSGKSFIPILIGTGCGVPGIMSARTIENDRDRKITIMTTTFIPCSAKLPIIALIAGAVFSGAWWVAVTSYFIGMAAIICSGVILKKTRLFSGEVAPFVMELPPYHLPTIGSILRSMWERGWSFIKKAGTIILLGAAFVWFTSSFGFVDGKFGMTEMSDSILAKIGSAFAVLFAPLGWGDWKSAVAALTGLVAKENIVGTFGILYDFSEVSDNGAEVWGSLAASFTAISGFSFLLFNLLCAPCFAAMGAIKREMNNIKWFFIAIGYQCLLAYIVALCYYQLGMLFASGVFGVGTVFAFLFVAAFIYLLFRPEKKKLVLQSS